MVDMTWIGWFGSYDWGGRAGNLWLAERQTGVEGRPSTNRYKSPTEFVVVAKHRSTHSGGEQLTDHTVHLFYSVISKLPRRKTTNFEMISFRRNIPAYFPSSSTTTIVSKPLETITDNAS